MSTTANRISVYLPLISAAFAFVASSANGDKLEEAQYSYENDGATLVATVEKGDEAPFDPAKLTSAVTKIVKRGEGILLAEAASSSSLSAFTGDFSIENGIYWYKHEYGFGSHAASTVDILDGAMIRSSGSPEGALDNKTVNFYGAPPTPQWINGSWYSMSGKTHLDGLSQKRIGENARIVLHDADSNFIFRNSGCTLNGTIDLAGRELTLSSIGETVYITLGGSVTNGGSLVVTNATIINAPNANFEFAADCAATASLRLSANSILNFKSGTTFSNGWTLELDGGHARGNKVRLPTETDDPNWDGPVKVVGDSSMATYDGYSQWAYRTVFNVRGPMSGSGALSVGPGWLNLFSSDVTSNTYSGTVSVTGQSADQTPEWKTPPGGGGIGVWNGSKSLSNAQSVVFNDSARLEFMDDVPTALPTLVFAGGAGDFQSVKGGDCTSRSTVAGISKTGEGTLMLASPVNLTGPLSVSGGVLQIPGSGGLREWMVTSSVDSVGKSLQPWNITDSRIDVSDLGIKADGPHVLLSQDYWPARGSRPSQRYGYFYRGYVWNDNDAPITMKVLHGLFPYTHVWFGEDHSTSMEFQSGDVDPKEVVLQPGATEVVAYGFTYQGNVQWWHPPFGKLGLSYATNTTWTIEEFSAAARAYVEEPSDANTNALRAMVAEMTPFADDGTGRFLTAWPVEGEESHLPAIDDVVCSNGACLDFCHNSDFAVRNLTGSPAVVNLMRFSVTNKWTILAADFPKADSSTRRQMTVEGSLSFPEGTTFSIDDEDAMARAPGGLVVATATGGVVGSPIPASGLQKKWKLVARGNELKLLYSGGFMLFVK